MNFILNEVIGENDGLKITFSDDTEEEFCEEESNFIDEDEGEEQQEEDASFYRSIDNMERVKFSNQTTDPHEAVDELEDEYYGEDDMPELYNPENREDVEFDLFDNFLSKSQTFKNSLLHFSDVDNQFFYAVLHCKLNGQNVRLESAEKVLGTDFFIELNKIETRTMLDHTIFGFFDRC